MIKRISKKEKVERENSVHITKKSRTEVKETRNNKKEMNMGGAIERREGKKEEVKDKVKGRESKGKADNLKVKLSKLYID